jgi:hypothetical protein
VYTPRVASSQLSSFAALAAVTLLACDALLPGGSDAGALDAGDAATTSDASSSGCAHPASTGFLVCNFASSGTCVSYTGLGWQSTDKARADCSANGGIPAEGFCSTSNAGYAGRCVVDCGAQDEVVGFYVAASPEKLEADCKAAGTSYIGK